MTPSASAYLGGFEIADGYEDFLDRVENYNAGQYGANVDPSASYTSIPTNSGAWQKIQGGSGVYATAHFHFDRLSPGSAHNSGGPMAMVITTNDEGWNAGPQIYDYEVDSFDTGGIAPSQVDQLTFSYWVCPAIIAGADNMDNPIHGNSIGLQDSTGNTGLIVGNLIQNDPTGTHTISYYINGAWVDTNIAAATSYFQQFEVTIDFANDTVSLDMIDGGYLKSGTTMVGTGNRTTLINNATLNNSMDYLDTLRFTSAPGVTNAKQWLIDDFSFSATMVPEPSSAVMLSLSVVPMLLRRNRRS